MTKRKTSLTNLLLFTVFLFTFLIRIPTLSRPIYDSHNFRQTDTYAAILHFYEGKTDILHPKIFLANPPENIQRYFFREFPLYQYLIAILFRLFGENLVIARLFTIFLTAITACSIVIIGKKLFNERVGLISAIVFNCFPLSYFWGRSISPDVMALTFFVLSVVFLLSSKRGVTFFIVSSIFFSGAVLIKPFYLGFIILHLCLLKNKVIYYYILPLIFFGGWCAWVFHFPEYTRVEPGIINFLHGRLGYYQFLKESNWTTLLIQRSLFGGVFTPLGGILSVIGLTLINVKTEKYKYFVNRYLLSSLLVSLVVAWGSREHAYYLLYWLPLGAILTGYTIANFFSKIRSALQILVFAFAVFLFGVLPFIYFAKNEFFSVQALYSPNFVQDYEEVKKITSENDNLLTILELYNSFVLNFVRREGFVYNISSLQDCPNLAEFNEKVDLFVKFGASQLLFQKNDREKYPSTCPRSQISEYINKDKNKVLIYSGKEFDLYKIIGQK